MLSNVLTQIFGSRNQRLLKTYDKFVQRANALEPAMQAASDDELRAKTVELRQRHQNGESLDQLLPDAFAAVREASRRTLGLRHFDVDDITELALRVIGDADGGYVTVVVEFDPFVLFGVIAGHWPAPWR